MKLITHVVFGAGPGYALLASMPGSFGALVDGVLAVALSYAVNYLIDVIGHGGRDGRSARSPVTHSVFTAPLWGAAVGYLVWLAVASLGLSGPSLQWPPVILGVVAACSHLLLDSITEGGVYFTTGRVALAHFGNGNVLLNAAFVLCGIALLLL